MRITLHSIRGALEGAVPAAIATCARDGTPNVSYVSEVHYIDDSHVALSFQFFSKTRQNVLENPQATALVIDPHTAAQYKLSLRYLRTEASGPLFESMKAKLAGIASQTGMAGVFRLRGSDVYQVEQIDQVAPGVLPLPPPGCNHLAVVRGCTARLTGCADLATLLDELLAALRDQLHVTHAMVLMLDPGSRRLFTVASLGYPQSGVGAELKLGEGVIGVAAQERAPIRISHATTEFGYGRALRESAATHGMSEVMEHEIPFPGLPESRSQLAVPIMASGDLLGVLFVESTEDGRFGYDEEDALAIIANHLGTAMRLLDQGAEAAEEARPAAGGRAPSGPALRIRRFLENDSIFIDEDYLIKGVAGAILWKLLRVYVDEQRTEHSNRELRLDPSIRLPDLSENLEARLILLQRRLEERCPHLRIEKTGRGRFRFHAARPLQLAEVSGR